MSNGAIGWDDEVSVADAGEQKKLAEFVTLPEGMYRVTINKVERGNFAGSAKMSACGMVKIGAIIDGNELGCGYCTTRFYMHTKTLFKIYNFLEALGLRKSGDKTSAAIPWNKVVKGLTCMAKIGIHEYNGTKSNEVIAWYPDQDNDMPEF